MPSSAQSALGRLRAFGTARLALRRCRPRPRCGEDWNAELESAARDPAPQEPARARQRRPDLVRRSTGAGAAQEAPFGGHSHLRRGGKHVLEEKRAGWRHPAPPRDRQRSFDPCLPADRQGAGFRGDERRRSEDPHPQLAHQPAVGRIVRHRIRAVPEWAIALDRRMDNPCDRLLPVLGSQNHLFRHRKAQQTTTSQRSAAG